MADQKEKLGSTGILLEIMDMNLQFGKVAVLSQVSFNAKSNEMLSIIGPNGAGKTSIINCICGFYKPDGGTISFEGREITGTGRIG